MRLAAELVLMVFVFGIVVCDVSLFRFMEKRRRADTRRHVSRR